jgi:hypothetical protein
VGGPVTCSVMEASCVCELPKGHTEDWHECKCGGRWPLSWQQDNALEVVRFPGFGPFVEE